MSCVKLHFDVTLQFDGSTCDVCASNPCLNSVLCMNNCGQAISYYRCLCIVGFTGIRCESSKIKRISELVHTVIFIRSMKLFNYMI